MATTATLQIAQPPANACPTGPYLPAVVNYLNANGTVTVTEDSTTSFTYFRQPATPTPVANGIWDRIGADGFLNEPLGRYVYFNGRWVPQVSHRAGDIMYTTYDPTLDIDSNGKGLFVRSSLDTANIAGPLFGWQLCNGQNGSFNLKNHFLLMGYQYTEGTGWVASVQNADGTFSDQTNGGRAGITLTLDNLPSVDGVEYNSAGNASTPVIYAGTKYTATPGLINPGTSAQNPIQPINPLYRVAGAFSWIGYFSGSQG